MQTSSEEVLKLQYSNSRSAKLSETAGNWRQFYILLLNQEKGLMQLIKEDFPEKNLPNNREPNKHRQGVLTL